MRTDKFPSFFLLLLLSFNGFAQASTQPVQLRCEYKINPNGIETQHPRLSWQLSVDEGKRAIMQSAYQIKVAGSLDDLEKGNNLLWDSGLQQSDHSTHIPYQGSPLNARGKYFWQVKIWDNRSEDGTQSEVAHWEMGLLDSTEWKAKWIDIK